MGAKQSKRSVDISGKEAEGAGEVAAAGAGGEGRVEPLADADALKPQLNGDAHIHEQTDKEKQLDSGTPENEKDATTEKENKQDDAEADKEVLPVTNGENEEPKTENGDTTPAPEEGKKPKKEKVKKKWSLRSISFSRKDKPKQEKKQKEEEAKTNGEPEKVPEEAAEATAEPVVNEVAAVTSETVEVKEEKTPETPVTEPITNGSSTPESPKVETPVVEEAVPVVASPEPEKIKPEPEQLPVNGLSLEESKSEETEKANVEESKPDETPAESTETAAIEIPVQKEVCVEMPLIEPTPPPLPANPPPSSVASFAATTMAPDLADASLVNTAAITLTTPSAVPDTKTDEKISETPFDITNPNVNVEIPSDKIVDNNDTIIKQVENDSNAAEDVPVKEEIEYKIENNATENSQNDVKLMDIVADTLATSEITAVSEELVTVVDTHESPKFIEQDPTPDPLPVPEPVIELVQIEPESIPPELPMPIAEAEILSLDKEDLPPPPPEDDDVAIDLITPIEHNATEKSIVNCAYNSEVIETNGDIVATLNGNVEVDTDECVKNKTKDSLGNLIETIECNGNVEIDEEIAVKTTPEETLPSPASLAEAGVEPSDAFPAPPCDMPQEPLPPVSDKITDLIPEVPVVPELKTETAQEVCDVAVAN